MGCAGSKDQKSSNQKSSKPAISEQEQKRRDALPWIEITVTDESEGTSGPLDVKIFFTAFDVKIKAREKELVSKAARRLRCTFENTELADDASLEKLGIQTGATLKMFDKPLADAKVNCNCPIRQCSPWRTT